MFIVWYQMVWINPIKCFFICTPQALTFVHVQINLHLSGCRQTMLTDDLNNHTTVLCMGWGQSTPGINEAQVLFSRLNPLQHDMLRTFKINQLPDKIKMNLTQCVESYNNGCRFG